MSAEGGEPTEKKEKSSFWLTRDTATGDWGGLRSRLNEAGVNPQVFYVTDVLANPVGGERQLSAYAGRLTAFLDMDLEKLIGVPGLSFFIAGSWSTGQNLSDTIPNYFQVAQIFSGRSVRLNQMYLQQTLFDERVNFAVGRLSVGNDFALLPVFQYYVSGAVNGTPFSLPVNTNGAFTTDPVASWGARLLVKPVEDFYAMVGVYNGFPGVADDDAHGVDFRLNTNDGVLVVGEIGYGIGAREGDSRLPGQYQVGVYVDTSRFPYLSDDTLSRRTNYGIYAEAQQMVWREPSTEDQGLIPWLALTFSPIERISVAPASVSGGLLYRGLIPGRDADVAALGVYYARFSNQIPDTSGETVLEVNYRMQFTPWFYITPVFQYVFRPGGSSAVDDAAVFGGEIGITF